MRQRQPAAMSMLVVCFSALVCAIEASSATSCAAAPEVEVTTEQMSGTALLQLKGAVKKVDAPPTAAAVTDAAKSVKPPVALAERSKPSGVIAKKLDDFSFNNNNNNNDNFNMNNNDNNNNLNMNNDNNNNDGAKDKKIPAKPKKGDKIIDTKTKKSDDAFDFGSNNNGDNDKDTCKDSYCPQDICPDGKGRRQVGKDCCSCKKAEPEIAVDNFDFGEGKIKTDKNAAVDSLKAQVAEAVSKVSSSLDEAATHEEAIRKRLEKMSTANEQDVKAISEELQQRLGEAEDSVHDAQKELRKLNRDAQLKLKYAEKSAASAHNFLACVCLSLLSLLF